MPNPGSPVSTFRIPPHGLRILPDVLIYSALIGRLSFVRMQYLFSYGTLQKSETQLKLLGRLLKGSNDTLKGYKTANIVIEDKLFLTIEGSQQLSAVVSSGDKIDGMVFEVSSEEIDMVDQYEPSNYERINVTLRSGKQAWLYLAA